MIARTLIAGAVLLTASLSYAQGIPLMVNYQGQVKDNGLPHDGVGHFKFALVNSAGDTTYWSNDGTSSAGSEPADGVTLNVTGGLFEVKLGDTSLANMTAIPATAIGSPDIRLRLWFSTDGAAYSLLAPDKQLTSVPYAYVAERVADNAIRGPELRRESVWPEHEGRSNTIVSYFATGVTDTPVTLGTIEVGKTYIITDILCHHSVSGASASVQLELHYVKDAQTTILTRTKRLIFPSSTDFGIDSSEYFGFIGGLVVPEGAELRAVSWLPGTSNPIDVTISGFAFQND